MKYVCKSGQTFMSFILSDNSERETVDPKVVAQRVGRLYLFMRNLFTSSSTGYIVYSRQEVPPEIASVCNRAGGDEDWYVVKLGPSEILLPSWLERIDADNDPDVYEFESEMWETNAHFTIYVGTH